MAFVLPGLVLAILLGVVGPVLVIEDLRVWPALKRSVRLVLPHFFLVFLLVFVPTSLEESFVEWAEHGAHGNVALWLVIDVSLTALVGSFVGLLEITLAHGLIADRTRRLADKAAGTGAEAAGPAGAEAQPVEAAGPCPGASRPAAAGPCPGPAGPGPAASRPDGAGPADKGPTAPGGGGAVG